MSIFSKPVVADTVARLFAVAVNPAPNAAVLFPEVQGRTSSASIPTGRWPVSATVYHPAADSGRPAVYVNVHGGGFVVGHPEQDDPWCRYLAAHANVVVVNPDYVLAPRHRRDAPNLRPHRRTHRACHGLNPKRRRPTAR